MPRSLPSPSRYAAMVDDLAMHFLEFAAKEPVLLQAQRIDDVLVFGIDCGRATDNQVRVALIRMREEHRKQANETSREAEMDTGTKPALRQLWPGKRRKRFSL